MTHDNLEPTSNGTGTDPTIEFCLNNVDRDQRVALSRREGAIRGSACLQRCGDCAAEQFLVIDGQYVTGDPLAIVDAMCDRGVSR